MTIRCKFFCSEVGESAWCNYDYGAKEQVVKKLCRAKMHAVGSSGSPENKMFFDATPQGSFEVSTVKDKLFEAGREYFIDITSA